MKKLILFFLMILLFSCEPPYDYYYTRSFVLMYCGAGRISVENSYNDKMQFRVDFGNSGAWSGVNSKADRKVRYDQLCEKHGDIGYNRRVAVYLNEFNFRCADDFVKLEITSSADWNANHPTGSPLGDIVRFIASTPLPYIRSGYTKKYSEEKNGEYYPIDKLVSELTPDDMMLLPMGITVRFTQAPTLSREHTLTVRLTTDEGKIFTASVDAVF